MNLTQLTLSELSQKFQDGGITASEITEAFIKNIEDNEKNINAFVTTTFDLARKQAKKSDERQKAGKLISRLDGMPITLKDIVCTKGIKTTAGSRMLENFIPPYSAEVWERLESAGCVLLGKTNTDEFAMGGSTETSAIGYTRNPHDLSRVAGGSSGGAAASVAANFCVGAIGTDTGGSIRQPAHFCGVTGIKVSYGRVSRYGCIAFASSLDSVGCFGKTAEDCGMILEIIAGKDEKDGTTPDISVPSYPAIMTAGKEGVAGVKNVENKKNVDVSKPLKNVKIGLPQEYFFAEGMAPEIKMVLENTKAILEKMGAELIEVSLPHTKYAVPIYYIVAPCEASANLARFDGVRFGPKTQGKDLEAIYNEARSSGFGDEVKRRILIGNYALSAGYYDAFYKKAQKVRTLVKQDFEKVFELVDVLLTPVDADIAFVAGDGYADPLKMYLQDTFVAPASIAGICGLSVPMGETKEKMPIGVQLLGPAFGEEKILSLAYQLQNFEK